MKTVILLLLGGAFGTGCRYALFTSINARIAEPGFPYAHLIINVSGSFLIGLLGELFDTRMPVSRPVRVALLTGVLGGYTTFSSFSLETWALLRAGEGGLAALNAAGSVLLGLAAVWGGIKLAQFMG